MWPFRKPERRQQGPYSDAIVAGIIAAAGGADAPGNANRTSALETCAGWWGRGLSCAVPTPMTAATAALTPSVLNQIGRQLARVGEALFLIDVSAAGRVRLLPAGAWDIDGGADPASWMYRLDVFGATRHVTRLVPSEAVLHVRYACDPSTPWKGMSPLQVAKATGALAGSLEARLGEEASHPVGSVIPMPEEPAADPEEDPLSPLAREIKALHGQPMLVETTSAGHGSGRADAPGGDWNPRRIGGSPPAASVQLRDASFRAVVAAHGVPVALVEKSDGTAMREGWRQFAIQLRALAAVIAEEAADKLDAPGLSFDLSQLRALDTQGAARAAKALTDAGLSPEQALAIAGLVQA